MLFATVKAGKEYTLTLDYSHSIVELHSFYDCPHVRLTIAMNSLKGARDKMKTHNSKDQAWISKEESRSNTELGQAFGLLQ